MMMATVLAWLLLAPVLLALAVLLVEVCLGLRSLRDQGCNPEAGRNVVVLMPAHNEAARIGGVIAALSPHLGEDISLLVVADNCSDGTADIARAAGVEVLERHDPARRGKGYALAFGRDHLAGDPPDCVVVLDADCQVESDTVPRLAALAVSSGRPVQSCYLMRPDHHAPMVEISNFAFLVKNLVRQRGAARLGAPALLVGTGMAFPWDLFGRAPLATGDLVEDLALTVAMVEEGRPPIFLEQARTWSDHALVADTLAQRTRWEHGFVATARRKALPLLLRGLAGLSPKRMWMGLHLLVPPLALLMLLAGAVLAAEAILWLSGASALPAMVLFAALAAAALALGVAWYRDGRAMLSARTLARIPLYVAWKLPLYLRLVRKPETEWQRTRRQGE